VGDPLSGGDLRCAEMVQAIRVLLFWWRRLPGSFRPRVAGQPGPRRSAPRCSASDRSPRASVDEPKVPSSSSPPLRNATRSSNPRGPLLRPHPFGPPTAGRGVIFGRIGPAVMSRSRENPPENPDQRLEASGAPSLKFFGRRINRGFAPFRHDRTLDRRGDRFLSHDPTRTKPPFSSRAGAEEKNPSIFRADGTNTAGREQITSAARDEALAQGRSPSNGLVILTDTPRLLEPRNHKPTRPGGASQPT